MGGCKKNILIFNTSIQASNPIYVIKTEEFGGVVDSDIPVVLGYNQFHYESLEPVSTDDIEKTKELVNSYISGSYQYTKKDIQFLISSPPTQERIETYDINFPPIQTLSQSSDNNRNDNIEKYKKKELKHASELTLDELKMIPVKNRSKEETKRYKYLMYKNRKENLTMERATIENVSQRYNDNIKNKKELKHASELTLDELKMIPLKIEVKKKTKDINT